MNVKRLWLVVTIFSSCTCSTGYAGVSDILTHAKTEHFMPLAGSFATGLAGAAVINKTEKALQSHSLFKLFEGNQKKLEMSAQLTLRHLFPYIASKCIKAPTSRIGIECGVDSYTGATSMPSFKEMKSYYHTMSALGLTALGATLIVTLPYWHSHIDMQSWKHWLTINSVSMCAPLISEHVFMPKALTKKEKVRLHRIQAWSNAIGAVLGGLLSIGLILSATNFSQANPA